MSTDEPSLWCRVETDGARVTRVNVMHPNGEILASWPPERFEPVALRRMRSGDVRVAVLVEEGSRRVALRDGSGRIFFSDVLAEP